MSVSLLPAEVRGADRDALVAFLTDSEWPFHVRRRPTVETVTAGIESGVYDDEDHAAFWLVTDGARVGLVVLQDLTDDAPLRAITAHVFDTRPQTDRFEGQTREDNVPMRRTFRRAGFVKEAHYREAWPVDGGRPVASVGYGILRRDWSSGVPTPVAWDDEPTTGSS